ncbi:MAG: hypothetical protein CVU85_04920 [Firmicutes bacterium HGW-Firmicutes-10]|nr:MAG: hypothetical protein CVU85_04920 [Firmicutes bacterium HGW-Firmicutes-10]
MRIGIFTDTYDPDINGVVRSINSLKQALVNNDHEVFIITNHPHIYKIEFKDRVLRLPGIRLNSLYGYVASSPIQKRAYEYVRRLSLDIIHVNTDFGIGYFGRYCGRKLNIPVVFTYHTEFESYTNYINPLKIKLVDTIGKFIVSKASKKLCKTCDAVIAPSKKTRNMLKKYGVTRRIFVVPTGLEIDTFYRHSIDYARNQDLRKSLGVRNEELLILYIGRVAPEKSIEILVDGFKKINQSVLPSKLLIVGDGPSYQSLRNSIDASLLDSVLFAGKIAMSEVPRYYSASDVFVSPSVTETQGLTFIEALACGLPLFAREDSALKDVVIENETGFYFKNSDDLARKLEYYASLSDVEKSKIFSKIFEKSREYDLDHFYTSIMDVYQLVK